MSAPVSQEAREALAAAYERANLICPAADVRAGNKIDWVREAVALDAITTARKQALEEAAKVTEVSRDRWQAYSRTGGATIGADRYDDHECDLVSRCCGGLAAYIRALGSQNDG